MSGIYSDRKFKNYKSNWNIKMYLSLTANQTALKLGAECRNYLGNSYDLAVERLYRRQPKIRHFTNTEC